jgi:IS1 family transposase
MRQKGWGDVWTWTAICPDTKLLVCWRVGLRETPDATLFMEDLRSRLLNRVQLSSDGHNSYLAAVINTFGDDVDYAMTIKKFGRDEDEDRINAKYSPTSCREVEKRVIAGKPDPDHISTSLNERHNLEMRTKIRRFTRLTNGFSKKRENHAHAVALHSMAYNFCKIHGTLRCTPAMEAGLSKKVWEISDIVALLNNPTTPRRAV